MFCFGFWNWMFNCFWRRFSCYVAHNLPLLLEPNLKTSPSEVPHLSNSSNSAVPPYFQPWDVCPGISEECNGSKNQLDSAFGYRSWTRTTRMVKRKSTMKISKLAWTPRAIHSNLIDWHEMFKNAYHIFIWALQPLPQPSEAEPLPNVAWRLVRANDAQVAWPVSADSPAARRFGWSKL